MHPVANRSFRLPIRLLLVVAAAACGDAPASAGTESRDSSGALITENSSPQWTGGEEWRLSDEPIVAIGVLDGDPRYQFERLGQVLRLADGRVLATDRQREMHFYDSAGRHLLTAGGEGSGPGEFRQLWSPYLVPPDSIFVLDIANRRFSVYDVAGTFVRDFPFSVSVSYPTGIAMLADRTAVGLATHSIRDLPDGVSRTTRPLIRFDLTGRVLDTLTTVPGWNTFKQQGSWLSTPFSPAPYIAARDSIIWVGAGDVYELRSIYPDGRLRRVIRLARQRRPLTQAEKDAWLERWTRSIGEDGGRPLMPPLPDSFPHFSRLLIDAGQHLWVRRYVPDFERGQVWDVFTPEGRWLGPVTFPDAFLLTEAGRDYAAGIWRDEDDVSYARVYELIKPQDGG